MGYAGRQGPVLVIARATERGALARGKPQVRRAAAALRGASVSAMLLLGVVALTMASGLILAPFYNARAELARASIASIEASPLLSVVRALHHWAAALSIVLGAHHLLRALLARAHRVTGRPGWYASIAIVLLIVLLQLTGHLLPWDRQGVRTAAVETGIAAGMPVVGPLQARLVRAGAAVGPQTLRAWYAAHVLLLPLAAAVCAWTIWRALRRRGPAWPRARRAAAALAVGLLAVSLLAPVPLGPAATAADYSSYDVRPEWYVLPLHTLLRLAQAVRPDAAFVGTAVVPGLLLAGLVAVPWLDRRRRGHAPGRWVGPAAGSGLAALAALFGLSVGEVAPLLGRGGPTPAFARGTPRAPQMLEPDSAMVARGRRLFASAGCTGCHALGGSGGASAPPLDYEGRIHPDRGWQMRHLADPGSVVPGSTMPPFGRLGDHDLRALAAFLTDGTGSDRPTPGSGPAPSSGGKR